MARIRTIKPELPQSESMGRVSREARLCFILLWTLADDSGRLRGNSRMLASLLYPYDDDAKEHMDGWLEELHAEGCIVRYDFEGDRFIQVAKWLSHQKIDKPSPSKIPAPDGKFANAREDSEKNAADQGRDQGVDQGEGEDAKELSQFLPNFQKAIKTTRADLSPDATWKAFCGYFPPNKRNLTNWNNWIAREKGGADAPPTTAHPDSRAAIEAIGMSLGFGKWNEATEQWPTYKARVKKGQPA